MSGSYKCDWLPEEEVIRLSEEIDRGLANDISLLSCMYAAFSSGESESNESLQISISSIITDITKKSMDNDVWDSLKIKLTNLDDELDGCSLADGLDACRASMQNARSRAYDKLAEITEAHLDDLILHFPLESLCRHLACLVAGDKKHKDYELKSMLLLVDCLHTMMRLKSEFDFNESDPIDESKLFGQWCLSIVNSLLSTYSEVFVLVFTHIFVMMSVTSGNRPAFHNIFVSIVKRLVNKGRSNLKSDEEKMAMLILEQNFGEEGIETICNEETM